MMETSGQGWFECETSHLNMRSGPAAASSVLEPVVHRGGRGAGGAVWNHLVGSSEKEFNRNLVRGQRRLLIVHGGQPPSLLLECCGEQRATLKLWAWGSRVEPPLMTFFDENRSRRCGGNPVCGYVRFRHPVNEFNAGSRRVGFTA